MCSFYHGEPPVSRVLDLLENVEGSSSGWTARCPAHPDQSPSLSIAEADDGRVLLFCHAGCPTSEILCALKLKWRHLFPGNGRDRDQE